MMLYDFTRFLHISIPILQKKIISLSQIPEIQILTDKKYIRYLQHLYEEIVLIKYRPTLASMNVYFLDLETNTGDIDISQKMEIVCNRQEKYDFLYHEIIQCFHHNLSCSSIHEDSIYHVTSLTKNFKLPTNPYSNKVFSIEEIYQIISCILRNSRIPFHFCFPPEVFLFLQYAEFILSCNPSQIKTTYEITSWLDSFFQEHDLQFDQKYNKNYNRSTWRCKTTKHSFTYYDFIQRIGIPFIFSKKKTIHPH